MVMTRFPSKTHWQRYRSGYGLQTKLGGNSMENSMEREANWNVRDPLGLRFDPSCVLYLPLGKKDGSTFMSSDAYGHLATRTGALWRPNGHYFDGTDDLIAANTVANNSIFGDAHTLIAWGSLTAWAADRTIMAGAVTTAVRPYSAITFVTASKKWKAETDGAVFGLNTVLSTNTYNNDTSFHFLALVVDADGKIVRFIIDATDQGSAGTNTNDLSGINKFYIGQLPYNLPNITPFRGTIGEGFVFSRALSASKIQQIYLATRWRYQ